MSLIRVALIGLSASAKTSWAGDAHLPYLISPIGRTHIKVGALLNSSFAAAAASKQHFQLPSAVKAYGDPQALARDLDIDLVVCCTRVDVHYPTIAPSLRAGKSVFVEWPLAENIEKARELLAIAKDNGVDASKCIIGLQSRVSPLTLRIKDVLASGTIGTVLSSNVTTFGHLLPRDSLPDSVAYFADRKTGGNPVMIENGHALDYIHHVLGEFKSFDARMQTQRPTLKIFNADGKTTGSVDTDIPDLFSIHGPLIPSDGKVKVAANATLAQTFRLGPPVKNQPTTSWSIAGTTGELLITIQGHFYHSHTIDPVTIQHHDHATDEVTEIEWDWAEYQKELPIRSRMIAEVYERYAEWGREWPGLDDAGVRM
ncbi:oxidoreductase family protein [Ophiobolus disseminans]|uniref:Oxidoreductase family protein n=1 Tax=Ophiobolus disseminans TaxID=1469910 RepID=A0A6A6ZJT3_9PLEO|nr:oxidoreductase family protein [Ophiobolus disseminans]